MKKYAGHILNVQGGSVTAVEMALWDILGKSLNVPVYQLLGGKVNDKVRIYVNGWFAGAKEPEEFGAKAKEAVKRGVTAMKWTHLERTI